MRDHFPAINQVEWDKLVNVHKITPRQILESVSKFDFLKTRLPLTYVNLYYYIDNFGTWIKGPKVPHKRIAEALFNSLDTKRKLEVLSYVDYIINGDDE